MARFGMVSVSHGHDNNVVDWECKLLLVKGKKYTRRLTPYSKPPDGCEYKLEHAMHTGCCLSCLSSNAGDGGTDGTGVES